MAGLQPMMRCRQLTIVEGPDGSGKSTFARAYAVKTQAHYVHFGPLLKMSQQLPRMYVEAMRPALMGWTDVVFDRSWLSESPYGTVYRGGDDRVGPIAQRMLERLAMRCETVVIKCLPPWETVKKNFLSRRSDEYLDDTRQLKEVYTLYQKQKTALPVYHYDYTSGNASSVDVQLKQLRTNPHQLDIRSAGNFDATCVLVGEGFTEPTQYDAYYQWPFGSFARSGCSYWLTNQLHEANIDERALFWVNCDQPMFWTVLPKVDGTRICALGAKASNVLTKGKIEHTVYEHPQAHKRFSFKTAYKLIPDLKRLTKGRPCTYQR